MKPGGKVIIVRFQMVVDKSGKKLIISAIKVPIKKNRYLQVRHERTFNIKCA